VAEPTELAEPFAYPLDEEPGYRALFPGVDRVVVGTFLVEAPAGWEPTLNDEHDEYRWCARDEAIALLRWPEPKALLRTL
jgi:8-oxo-dGTP pyrophosphatase MutT (NUDIX family)